MEGMFNDDGTILKMRAPYDPNGNALAERTIRTIVEMARTLLISSGLPKNRWEEAIDHAVWIRNSENPSTPSENTLRSPLEIQT